MKHGECIGRERTRNAHVAGHSALSNKTRGFLSHSVKSQSHFLRGGDNHSKRSFGCSKSELFLSALTHRPPPRYLVRPVRVARLRVYDGQRTLLSCSIAQRAWNNCRQHRSAPDVNSIRVRLVTATGSDVF